MYLSNLGTLGSPRGCDLRTVSEFSGGENSYLVNAGARG